MMKLWKKNLVELKNINILKLMIAGVILVEKDLWQKDIYVNIQ